MSGPVLYMSMLFLPSDVNLFDDLVLIFLVKDFFLLPTTQLCGVRGC